MKGYRHKEMPLTLHIRSTTPVVPYAMDLLSAFTDGGYEKIHLSALGQAISKAVDIAQVVLRTRPDITYKVNIGTEILTDESYAPESSRFRHVSFMTIDLTAPPKENKQ